MRKLFLTAIAVCTIGAVIAPAATAATTVGDDSRVTRQRYVRHDGGTDAAIEICNSTAPADYGNRTVNNEPFSVVNPAGSGPRRRRMERLLLGLDGARLLDRRR